MANKDQSPFSTEADSILAVGLAMAQPRAVAGGAIPFTIVPEGYKVASLEAMLDKPVRAKGLTKALDVDSFVRLVNMDKGAGTRIYFRGTDAPAFRAVFNAISAAAPDHDDHMAQYECPLSDEWKDWIGSDGKQMVQVNFANFVEQNALDIIAPSSAEMVQVSRTFEAKKNVEFKSGVRLNDGTVQFTYNEVMESKAGQQGQFSVPEQFTIAIPVFRTAAGEAKVRYEIVAKLRYRVDQKLVIWYELIKPERVLEAATGDVRKVIDNGTGLKSLNTLF